MMRLLDQMFRKVLLAPALRRPMTVVLAAGFLAALSLLLAATRLEFHTNRLDLISSGDRYKKLEERYGQEFEELPERVVVVIRSENPATAKGFAAALGRRWETDPHIDKVFYRIGLDSLKNKALLYLSPDDLIALRQKLHEHQGLLEDLAASPTLQNLFALINREMTATLVGHVFTGFLEEDVQEKEPLDFSLLLSILRQMNQRLDGPHAYRSPWETLFTKDAEASSQDGFLWSDDKHLLFVLANPKAEAGSFNRFKRPVQQIRADVRELQKDYPEVEVGITGKAVLESDEMAAAQRDMTIATLISLLGVAFLFVVFFRGVVRPALAVTTLIIGLSWSLGFLTLTIGHLNILTIVFMPMLIGLGIDFPIHFIARYEEERAGGRDTRRALERTFSGTGMGILAAALTTAFAFSTLLLTGFKGLMELGFISGSGLLLAVLATFTALPALLVFHERQRTVGVPTQGRLRAGARVGYLEPLYRYPWATLAASALLVGVSLLALGRVRSDFNLLHLQSEGTESVIWEQKIFESTKRSVLFGEIAAGSLEEVKRKVAALKSLPSVAEVESIASVIPEDQERKLRLIKELRPLLADISLQRVKADSVDFAALRSVLEGIKFKMVEDSGAPPEMREVRRLIERFLETTGRMSETDVRQALSGFQEELGRDLEEKLAILKGNLQAEPMTIADLPPELRTRYVGKTGKYRLFVFPSEDVWEFHPLARFVADLTSVDPDALGAPVTNFAYLRATKEGYEKAGLYAFLGVAFLALLTFRAVVPTLLALVPLAVGAVWTLGLMALLQVPFNVANLLFLPLIAGIGIGNGIHVVHRFRESKHVAGEPSPLARSTGKAIALSSLTTMVGFGSLMISNHRGIHSLGLVITLGVGSVLAASVTVLPGLLLILSRRRGRVADLSREQREPSAVLDPVIIDLTPHLAPAPSEWFASRQKSHSPEAVGAKAAAGADGNAKRGLAP